MGWFRSLSSLLILSDYEIVYVDLASMFLFGFYLGSVRSGFRFRGMDLVVWYSFFNCESSLRLRIYRLARQSRYGGWNPRFRSIAIIALWQVRYGVLTQHVRILGMDSSSMSHCRIYSSPCAVWILFLLSEYNNIDFVAFSTRHCWVMEISLRYRLPQTLLLAIHSTVASSVMMHTSKRSVVRSRWPNLRHHDPDHELSFL